MTAEAPHAIKCRLAGKRVWYFLTPDSNLTRLKIHAGRFTSKDKAQTVVDENIGDNAEWEFKVVAL